MDTARKSRGDTASAVFALPPSQLHSSGVVPSRRLDDKIRELCARAVQSPNGGSEKILEELRHAIREKTQRLRWLAADKLVAKYPAHHERRSHGSVSERH